MLPEYKFVVLFLFCVATSSVSKQYQGIVYGVDSKPVKGVTVSIGHTQNRTNTDNEGRFFLSSGGTAALKTVKKFNSPVHVKWDHRTGLINLSNVASFNKISLFDLKGRVLFQAGLAENSRNIKIPFIAKGIYLLRLNRKTGSPYNFKINTALSSVFLALEPDYFLPEKASACKSAKLLFRHDNYFPVDREFNDYNQNITILMKEDPRSRLFNPEVVHSFQFTIAVEDSLNMEKNALEENYVPAELSYNGQALGKVGLRYKGSTYSLSNCFDINGNRKPECTKVSLKVKFNKYNDKLRLYEMKELNLHAMSVDVSKMREMLAYQMFRDMGIYSPRTSYATIHINGVFQGIRVAVEEIDGRFTKSRWPLHGDGNLYKEAWPRINSADYYRQRLKTNNDFPDNVDVSGMIDLCSAIDMSTAETFSKNVGQFIDLDYMIRYMVVDRAIKNWDGITAWYAVIGWKNNHNFFFYEEENDDGKIWLIPWDLDHTFPVSDPFIDDSNIPDWNQNAQNCDPGVGFTDFWIVPSNCDKFTALLAETGWNDFVKTGNEFLKTVFDSNTIAKKIDTYGVLIDTLIKNDPVVDYDAWKNDISFLKSHILSLHNRFINYVNQTPEIIDISDYSTP